MLLPDNGEDLRKTRGRETLTARQFYPIAARHALMNLPVAHVVNGNDIS